ncbi:hypothetical protein D9M71_671260 [compost metagenome]
MQFIGQGQARGQVTGFLPSAVFCACQAGIGVAELGDVAHVFPVGDDFVIRRPRANHQVRRVFATLSLAITDHQLVFSTEQRVGA